MPFESVSWERREVCGITKTSLGVTVKVGCFFHKQHSGHIAGKKKNSVSAKLKSPFIDF